MAALSLSFLFWEAGLDHITFWGGNVTKHRKLSAWEEHREHSLTGGWYYSAEWTPFSWGC